MILLEGAKATTETVDALRTGAQAMKDIHKSTYVASGLSLLYQATTYTSVFCVINILMTGNQEC